MILWRTEGLKLKAKNLSDEFLESMLSAQKNEITEHLIYEKLASSIKDPRNREVLRRISMDELEHYNFWRKYTGRDVKPDRLKIWKYFIISKIFGITFGMKLVEKGEEKAQNIYKKIAEKLPEAKEIVEDEDEHEKELLDLIDEERLRYVGSMVLGLNDALVELTGALAGLTLTLQNAHLVAVTGLITGVAASLSMATSEYLSTKSEGDGKKPFKAAVYTGFAYVLTVLLLILPYLIIPNLLICLGLTILDGILVIFIFTYYISVARELPFRKHFLEMAAVSLGVAGFTFLIGFLITTFLNIEV